MLTAEYTQTQTRTRCSIIRDLLGLVCSVGDAAYIIDVLAVHLPVWLEDGLVIVHIVM